MNLRQYSKGWTLNYIIEPAHISTDFTPPISIDDLIEPPDDGMRATFPMGYPTRDDAVAALKDRIPFSLNNLQFARKAHEANGSLDADIAKYFDKYEAYVVAASALVEPNEA